MHVTNELALFVGIHVLALLLSADLSHCTVEIRLRKVYLSNADLSHCTVGQCQHTHSISLAVAGTWF